MIIGNCRFCKKTFRKREAKRKFCSQICANNYNKNGLKQIVPPLYSIDLAELVGICLGDGCITKYQVSVTLNTKADSEYIPYVADLLKRLFPENRISSILRKDGATDVRINSKLIADFFRDMGIIPNKKVIPSWIYSKVEYKYACIRGLFHTEGSISFKKYKSRKGISLYKQLNFRNTQKEFMIFVRDVLLELGLNPTKTLTKSLYISNDGDLEVFKKYIGFSNPKLQQKSMTNTVENGNKSFRK